MTDGSIDDDENNGDIDVKKVEDKSSRIIEVKCEKVDKNIYLFLFTCERI